MPTTRPCKDLWKDPGFYFKIIELAICLVGTFIYTVLFDVQYGMQRSTYMALAVAVINTIITHTMLAMTYVFNKKSDLAELIINVGGTALNICVGAFLFCLIGSYNSAYFCLQAGLCIGCGVVMLFDVVRLMKKGGTRVSLN